MDVDNELLNSFRTMNTNDKDYLISEFRRLSNTELTNDGCCFYLDLAEWNLNCALWNYYENGGMEAWNVPEMKFMCDVTIGEGESVAPSTLFVKTWRVKNIGTKAWPYGCQLKLVNGYNLSERFSSVILPGLMPDDTLDVSIELKSPENAGLYQSQYRLYTSTNTPFGDPIWLVLNVEIGGVLGITQQLNSVNMDTTSAFATNSNQRSLSSTNLSMFSIPQQLINQTTTNASSPSSSTTNSSHSAANSFTKS